MTGRGDNGGATMWCVSTRRSFVRSAAAAACLALAALRADAQVARGASGGGPPPRDEWQRVPEIVAALALAGGQRVADVAAGQGYLTRTLARVVGASGRVYAVEIDEGARRALARLAADSALTNVEVVAGTETDPRLPAPVDAIVVL